MAEDDDRILEGGTIMNDIIQIQKIKYLDVGPQAQLPPPYAEDINALLTMVLSKIGPFRHSIAYAKRSA